MGTFTPSAPITDASNVITVANTFTDLALNANTAGGTSANYAVDTVRPVVSSVVMSDTALQIGDTSVVTITMSEAVTGFSNADVTVENGTLSTLTSADGITWVGTFTPTAAIEDASNVITVANTFTDIALNANTAGGTSANYAIDTLAPVAPTVTGTNGDVFIPASGSVSSYYYESGTTPLTGQTISGTAEAGSTVEIYDKVEAVSVKIAEGIAGADGSFSITQNVNSLQGVAGQHTLTAYSTDPAGNTSPISTSNFGFKLNTVELAMNTVEITNANAASVSVKQGEWTGVSNLGEVGVLSNTTPGTLSYSLVTDISGTTAATNPNFTITASGPNAGRIMFTETGAASVAANPDQIGAHPLFVKVTDSLTGGSDVAPITVNVQSALHYTAGVALGYATLPGSISDWEFTPVTKLVGGDPVSNGFVLTHHRTGHEDIVVNIPSDIGSVRFEKTDGATTVTSTVALNNNVTVSQAIGTVTINSDSFTNATGTQNIYISPGSMEDTVVVLPANLGVTVNVRGAQDAAPNPFSILATNVTVGASGLDHYALSGSTITGTVHAGYVVDVSKAGQSLGAVTADAAGHFTFTLPAGTVSSGIELTAMPVEDNYRGDMVSVNAARSAAHFAWASDNSYVTMTLDVAGGGVSTTILRDVESVKFTGGASAETVRIVGAGGYASVQDATNAHGGSFATSNIVFAPLTLNASNNVTGNVVEDSTSAVVGLANTVSGNLTASVASVLVNGQANAASYGVVNLGSIGSVLVSEYGSLTIDNQGHWQYDLIANKTALQALGGGVHHNDVFTIRVKDSQGGFIDQQITIDIVGTNDAARITGAATGGVTEDGGLLNAIAGSAFVTGTLISNDVDNNSSFTSVTTATTSVGGYGTYTMTSGGLWTYNLSNTNSTVQALHANQTLTDTFTVASIDGTSQLVTVTINGAEDAAVITGTSTGIVTEAGGVSNATIGTVSASGNLSSADVDNNSTFTEVAAATVSNAGYGTYTMTSGGAWTYNLSDTNTAVQALHANQTLTDTFTVTSIDGTAKVVTVTINGAEDAAVITGSAVGAVTEASGLSNVIAGTATATGTLYSADVDNTANLFTAVSSATTSVGGYGTYTMTSGGAWTYNLSNTNATVQALNTNQTLTDTFTVTSIDGTQQVVSVTINGINDAAVITGTSVGGVIEAGGSLNTVLGTASATGTLISTDVDNNSTFTEVAVATVSSAGYGTYTMTSGGAWTYNLSDTNTAVQALHANQTLTDTFTVTSIDGTAKVVTVTINGAEDAAVITGSAVGAVTEASGLSNVIAGTATATGTLYSADVDNTANLFTAVSSATTSVGGYGTYTMTSGGAWTYNLSNTNTAVQALHANQTLTDTFTVTSIDGTSKQVTVTINGAEDAAVITGTVIGSVTEASGLLNAIAGTASASGTLTSADPDNLSTFNPVTNVAASYGTYTMTSGGAWTYNLSDTNAAVQALHANQTLTDTFTVTSIDGTSKQVTVTINGAEDAAVITGTVIGSVTEASGLLNAIAGTASASGTLTSADPDNLSTFNPVTNVAASYGTYTMTSGGTWTYNLSDTNTAVQALHANQTLTDTFTVTSIDGTSQLVTVTINGAEDAAVITGTSTGSVIEAGGDLNAIVGTASVTGTLYSADVDNNSSFTAIAAAIVSDVGYGTYTMTSGGLWTYNLSDTNTAVQALHANQTLTDTFTVTSIDGTSKQVTVTINGTEDAPTIGSHTDVTIVQGQEGVQVVDKFNAVDPEGDTVAFSLTGTNSSLFVIDPTGQITLTAAGSAYVASQVGTEGATGDVTFNLTVHALGSNSVESTQAVTITVDMAQKSSTAASLPGSISDWSIASNGAGFVLTDLSSLTTTPVTPVQVSLSSSVTSLTFSDGTINLVDGTAGAADRITIGSGFADVKLTLAPSADNTLIVLNDAHVGSGHSEVTGGAGTDTVRIVSTMTMADLASFSIDGGWLKVTSQTGDTWMKDVERIEFANTDGTVHTTVRIVGANGYASLSAATADAQAGDVIYVSDLSLAVDQEVATSNQISIFVAGTSPGTTINLTAAATVASINVDMYGSHNYALVGSSGADTMHDFSTAAAVSLSGMDGDDKIVVHTSDASHAASVFGGAGADTLIGGTGAVISGGDGNDKLLAYGAASLTGGAGDDMLFNSSTAANAVVMTGGSGSDTFALIGGTNAGATGSMNTVIADLGTGDKINLSYLEKAGDNTSIDTTANFTGAGGTATQSAAGSKLLFGANIIATSSQVDDAITDVNSLVQGGTLNVSNATLTKTSAAINAGHDASPDVDFASTFGGPLNDTYNHHG